MRNILIIAFCLLAICSQAQSVYELPKSADSRLSSFENPNGEKGSGAKTNKGAKGNAFEFVKAGETKTLLDIKGEGLIQRIWLTVDQDPVKLRALRLQFFWDGSSKAAVDVPLGDFFCYNLGKSIAFQSAFFSSGEGKSFNCYIPMPFRKSAKILLINEGVVPAKLYYDVDFSYQPVSAEALYFHAYWNRKMTGELGEDYEFLPKINGKGRFLGVSVGLNTDSIYEHSWWGEGEVKMYMDGDDQYPTIAGTGSEDYIGSAWGLGKFINQYQGCQLASDSLRQFIFYRWHVPDPIYFKSAIRVVIQQIGGWGKIEMQSLLKKGVRFKAVSVDGPGGFLRLLEMKDPPNLESESFPDGWVNFYRIDDYSSVSYFYLDHPSSNLPALPSIAIRTLNVK